MKIKNLTPWCNLFSTELKYNIDIAPSRHRYWVYSVIYIISTLLFLWLYSLSTQLLAIVIAFITLIILGVIFSSKDMFINLSFINKFINTFFKFGRHRLNKFELHIDGKCYFNLGQLCRLHVNSRVGILGCWLVFIRVKNSQNLIDDTHQPFFIFKDSLSAQDYSRLCRVINHLNQNK